jgi:hypothetical protein
MISLFCRYLRSLDLSQSISDLDIWDFKSSTRLERNSWLAIFVQKCLKQTAFKGVTLLWCMFMLFHVYVYLCTSIGFWTLLDGFACVALYYWHIFQYFAQTSSAIFIPKKELHRPVRAGVFRPQGDQKRGLVLVFILLVCVLSILAWYIVRFPENWIISDLRLRN